MQIVGAIVGCLLIGYFWIWLVQHVVFKDRKKFSRSLLLTAGGLVLSLYLFSRVMDTFARHLEIPLWSSPTITLSRFGYFLLYCGLIFFFLILFYQQRKNKHVRFLFLVWLTLFAVIGIFGFQVGLQGVMLVVVSAYAEEFLKIGATENALKKADFYSSDVLFLSVLVALGFSLVENIFYLGQSALGNAPGLLSMMFGRGIFSSLIHLIATGTIALLLYKLYQSVQFQTLTSRKKVGRVMLCMLGGVALHLGYNLLIGHFWVYIFVVIGGYFLLSYILFLSDSLYKEK